jgi:hypothetical protein
MERLNLTLGRKVTSQLVLVVFVFLILASSVMDGKSAKKRLVDSIRFIPSKIIKEAFVTRHKKKGYSPFVVQVVGDFSNFKLNS